MRFGGRVEPVDCFGDDRDGGVKAKSLVGALNVIVDGLGHADHFDPFGGECPSDTQGVLTAHGDQVIHFLQIPEHFFLVRFALEWVGARRAQDGSTPREDSGNRKQRERLHEALDKPQPSVLDAHHLISQHLRTTYHGADHRVQSGAVPAPR